MSDPTITVQVATKERVPSKKEFERWARRALGDDPKEVCIRVMDESEAKCLNQTFRHQNRATNVLAFPADEPNLLGDIAICSQVTATEAKEYGRPLHDHYAHLVIHGILHLQGFDHTNPQDTQTMQVKEVQLLASLGIRNPYEST